MWRYRKGENTTGANIILDKKVSGVFLTAWGAFRR